MTFSFTVLFSYKPSEQTNNMSKRYRELTQAEIMRAMRAGGAARGSEEYDTEYSTIGLVRREARFNHNVVEMIMHDKSNALKKRSHMVHYVKRTRRVIFLS